MDKIQKKIKYRFNDQICIIMVRSNSRKCRGGETRQLTTHQVQQKSSKYQNMKYWSIELLRLCWKLIERRKKKRRKKTVQLGFLRQLADGDMGEQCRKNNSFFFLFCLCIFLFFTIMHPVERRKFAQEEAVGPEVISYVHRKQLS